MSSSKNKSESRRQEKIVKARAHKSNEVKRIHFLLLQAFGCVSFVTKISTHRRKGVGPKHPGDRLKNEQHLF